MQLSTTSYLNSTYSTDRSNKPPSNELGKDAFMKLLVAQMSNQNPLKPKDDTEQLTQLAQFSSLEQLTDLNSKTDGTNKTLGAISVTNAVGYIGKDVVAGGNNISKTGSTCSPVYYTISDEVSTVKAHVYDADKRIVDTVTLKGTAKGEHTFTWDGENSKGKLPDGKYTIGFEARDENGKLMKVGSKVAGKVTGITSGGSGTVLELEGGRVVNLVDITRVEEPKPTDKDDS